MSKLKRYKVHGFTAKELALITPWKDVLRALKYHYKKTSKDTYERYQEIFEEIKTAKWDKELDSKEKIRITCFSDFFDEDITQYYSIATNKYSMMFRRWAELANIKIEDRTLDNNLREEVLAHFLWEITYSGFHEKKIQKIGAKLNKSYDDIKSGKVKPIPFDPTEFEKYGKTKEKNSKLGVKAKREKT